MSTPIYIISGFLGAGKTTLIQKLLRERFGGESPALIENDFGDISVDAALLQSGSVRVREINAGCICCSLSGDFVAAMEELLAQYQPSAILIEPSGVGKLSDILRACADPRVAAGISLQTAVTVADARRCALYRENFGEFFEDQIQHAGTVLLSRSDSADDPCVHDACRLIAELNPRVRVLHGNWSTLTAAEILEEAAPSVSSPESGEPAARESCACGHPHEEHTHGHEHHHTAEEAFDTLTLHPRQTFRQDELEQRITRTAELAGGTLLRVKGFLNTDKGQVEIQYVPGELRVTPSAVSEEPLLCLIGRNLSRAGLYGFWEGR